MVGNALLRGRIRTSAEGGGGGGAGPEGNPPPPNEQPPPKSQWKPPADEGEFNRIIEDRLKRERSKYRDYEALQAKAQMWDELEAESQTDRERELRETREEAFQEFMSHTVPRLVKAEFKAQARGRMTADQLDSLLEDLDLTKYANDDGEPDEDKIAKKIDTITGGQGGGGSNGRNLGFGQGSGYSQSPKAKGEGGLLEARKRWGDKVAKAQS